MIKAISARNASTGMFMSFCLDYTYAGKAGFEPAFVVPKTTVLPLNDFPMTLTVYSYIPYSVTGYAFSATPFTRSQAHDAIFPVRYFLCQVKTRHQVLRTIRIPIFRSCERTSDSLFCNS